MAPFFATSSNLDPEANCVSFGKTFQVLFPKGFIDIFCFAFWTDLDYVSGAFGWDKVFATNEEAIFSLEFSVFVSPRCVDKAHLHTVTKPAWVY